MLSLRGHEQYPPSPCTLSMALSIQLMPSQRHQALQCSTAQSAVTYDFGKNIAGIVSFNVSSSQGSDQFIGISFTESSLWINSNGCDATADAGIDEALWFSINGPGMHTASKEHQRGAFRYLNVYHNSTGSVAISDLSVYFTASPQVKDSSLGQYTGYFHSNDEQLNRIWYAGAYTNEMCTIDPTAGDALVWFEKINSTETITTPLAWYNNYTISNGTSVSDRRCKTGSTGLAWRHGNLSTIHRCIHIRADNHQELLGLSSDPAEQDDRRPALRRCSLRPRSRFRQLHIPPLLINWHIRLLSLHWRSEVRQSLLAYLQVRAQLTP